MSTEFEVAVKRIAHARAALRDAVDIKAVLKKRGNTSDYPDLRPFSSRIEGYEKLVSKTIKRPSRWTENVKKVIAAGAGALEIERKIAPINRLYHAEMKTVEAQRKEAAQRATRQQKIRDWNDKKYNSPKWGELALTPGRTTKRYRDEED